MERSWKTAFPQGAENEGTGFRKKDWMKINPAEGAQW